MLRYKEPAKREFRVPVNFHIGKTEIPLGLALITLTLIALCGINLFTKEVATISGIAFTIIFFAVFELSEKVTRKRASQRAELDQFNIEPGDDLTPKALGVRPGNVLVMIRNYNNRRNRVLPCGPGYGQVVDFQPLYLLRTSENDCSAVSPPEAF